MKKPPNLSHIILLFIIFCFQLQAQGNQEIMLLSEVLKKVEVKYNYQFNYAEDVIADITIYPPDFRGDFKQILIYLTTHTQLVFTDIGDRIISIKPKPPVKICAYIIDKNSQFPVFGATVRTGKKSTITNTEGYFEIEVPENSLLEIRHLGYKSILRQTRYFRLEDCGKIYMIPEVEALEEIVLSSYLIRGIDKLNNGANRINFKKFSILPGLINTDVLQAIQAFPGIQSINETVSNINIRGGTNDQNLILWDGIKMYQTGHFFGLISMFNPNITQEARIQKNGTNVSYSDGVSGSIILSSDKNLNNKFKGNADLNFIDANFFTDIPLSEKSSLQIAARSSISALVTTPTFDVFFDRIAQDTELNSNTSGVFDTGVDFNFFDGSFRWLYKPNIDNEIRLNFIITGNQLTFDEIATVNGEEQSRESRLSQNSIAGGFQYKRIWSDTFETIFDIYETDYTIEGLNSDIIQNQEFLQENSVSETGIKLRTNYEISKRLKWLNGYQFTETKVTNLNDIDAPRFRTLVGEVIREHALFSSLNFITKNKESTVNAGVRLNYIDKLNTFRIEPRISFNQRFSKNFILEILGEQKHQSISQIINFQNDFLGIERRRWQLSNGEEIPLITSSQVSLGVQFNKNGWLLSTDFFYKSVNGITSQSQGFLNQFEFSETIGSYTAIGSELLISKQLKNITAWFSYSYLNSNYTFEDLFEDEFPNNFNIPHSMNIGFNYIQKQFKFSAGLHWRSGRPITNLNPDMPVTDGSLNFETPNSSRLDSFIRLDTSASYQFKFGKGVYGSFGISVWNVLNTENRIDNFFRLTSNNTQQEFFRNALGITPNTFFKVSF